MVDKEKTIQIGDKCFTIIYVRDDQNPHLYCNDTDNSCNIVVVNLDDNNSVIYCQDESQNYDELNPSKLMKLYNSIP